MSAFDRSFAALAQYKATTGRVMPVVADAGYGDATGFREGLTERALAYAVAVKGTTTAYPGDAASERPPYSGTGRPPSPAYPDPHTTLRQLALDAGRSAAPTVTWRLGSKTSKHNPRARPDPARSRP